MYGFFHCAWADMVVTLHGETIWRRVLKKAGFELGGGSFLIHKIYSDTDTESMFQATAEVLGLSRHKCFNVFGEHFFKYCMDSGYDRVIRVLGGNLLDFLCNLDALHDHFDSIYPGMRAPSFRCTATNDGGLLLHYYSTKPELYPIVMGVVTSASVMLYNVKVVVDRRPEMSTGRDHVVLYICEKNAVASGHTTVRKRSSSLATNYCRNRASTRPADLIVNARTFSRVFPFHVMFNRRLEIVQAGRAILRILQHTRRAKGDRPLIVNEIFDVIRPVIDFNFNSILGHINAVFAVQTKPGVIHPTGDHVSHPAGDVSEDSGKNSVVDGDVGEGSHVTSECQISSVQPISSTTVSTHTASSSGDGGGGGGGGSGTNKSKNKVRSICMRLKGQMVFVPESDSILFLCSPRVCNLDDLKCKGLYLSDIPLHDATRDLILISQARRHERELVEKLEEASNNLQKLQARLQEDKHRTDELLHSILPFSVADKLRLNQPVEAEKYEMVTVLFADIVAFTSLCGNEGVMPIDIVRMLNRLYTQFDMLSSLNEVYKVETIGDAYMVVAGLPRYTEHHADHVISMAFGMMDVAGNVLSPVDQKPIQVRIGVHSGPCVAGVVGQKMPRYCLFGNTVTMASNMEASSLAGRINISEQSKRRLTNPIVYFFEENWTRLDMGLKCYFISQTPQSPRPVTMDLSLPVPKGMFRTPNPSPPGSMGASPCESPLLCSPVHQNSPEAMDTPAITISDGEQELQRMAHMVISMGPLREVENHIRQKLEGVASQQQTRSMSLVSGLWSPNDIPKFLINDMSEDASGTAKRAASGGGGWGWGDGKAGTGAGAGIEVPAAAGWVTSERHCPGRASPQIVLNGEEFFLDDDPMYPGCDYSAQGCGGGPTSFLADPHGSAAHVTATSALKNAYNGGGGGGGGGSGSGGGGGGGGGGAGSGGGDGGGGGGHWSSNSDHHDANGTSAEPYHNAPVNIRGGQHRQPSGSCIIRPTCISIRVTEAPADDIDIETDMTSHYARRIQSVDAMTLDTVQPLGDPDTDVTFPPADSATSGGDGRQPKTNTMPSSAYSESDPKHKHRAHEHEQPTSAGSDALQRDGGSIMVTSPCSLIAADFSRRKFSSPGRLSMEKGPSDLVSENGKISLDIRQNPRLVVYFRSRSRTPPPESRRLSEPFVRQRRSRTPEPRLSPMKFS